MFKIAILVCKVIISGAECLAGRYREARAVSRGVCAALRARGAAVPRDLRTALAVLHTYILVHWYTGLLPS